MGRQAEGLSHTWGHLGWRSSWPAALLAVSLLLPPAAGLSVTPVPPNPAEGGSVTLTPQGLSDSFISCSWFRAGTTDLKKRIFIYYPPPSPHGQINGPAYTERETIVATCSLQISDLMLNYSGIYTVSEDSATSAQASVNLTVSEVLSKPTVSVFPSQYCLEYIDSVQLTCNTSSTIASVSWLQDGQPLKHDSRIELSNNDRILSINNVSRSDYGGYQCKVTNLVNSTTSDIKHIYVIYGPDTPRIQPPQKLYSVHSDINLACETSVSPVAQYTWFFNGKEVGNKSELSFYDATREQSGNYTCQAKNMFSPQISSTTLEIEVVGGVYDVSITGPSTGIENHTVILQCTSVGPNVSYYWFKGDRLIEIGGGHIHLEDNNQTLRLEPTARGDTANYTCLGFNSITSASSEPHGLEILYGPDIPIIKPQQTVYPEGNTLILSCFADSNPPASFCWSHSGKQREGWNTSQLIIEDLSMSDSGNYICNATNNYTGISRDTSQEISVLESVSNITITGPTEAIEHTITTLNCTSKGTGVSYYWLKENQSPEVEGRIFLSNNNQTLTFNTTFRNDTGNYTCYGYNSFSNASDTYQLVVLYGPGPPTISPPTQDYVEGSNLSLSCKAESNPPAQYLWFVDGNPKGNGSELLTLKLSLNDAGNYICTAVNIRTKHNNSESLEIRVLQKVSNVTINGPSETIENTSVNLTCTSRGSMVTYYWFKGNQSLKSEGHVSLSPPANQSLIMNPVNRSDAGLYTCQGVNSISNDSSPSFPLEVFYGPDDPIISPTDQNYAEGSNLSLSCKAISNVHVQYTWLLNGTEEIFNETVGVGDASQLLIRNLSFNYSGTYTCHAFSNKTNVTSYSDQQPITVWENLNRTKTVLEPTEFMVPENWYVTLKCNTSKSDGVSVSWFKNGEALLTGTGLSDRNRTLNITGVSKNNTGFYTCEARNPVSKSLSNLSNITVAYGPDHIKFNQEGSIQQQIGSTLTLECIVDSVPAAQFQWWLNNTKLNKMGRIYTTQLTWEDGGNYTCQATNPFTNHSDSASVYVTLTKDSKPIGGGGLSGGAIAGIVIGVLAGVALIAGLVYYLCAKTSLGRTDQHASNGNIPSAPGRNQGATDTKPTSREEDIQYSTLAFNKTNASPPQPASEANQPLDSSTIYSEIKKK